MINDSLVDGNNVDLWDQEGVTEDNTTDTACRLSDVAFDAIE